MSTTLAPAPALDAPSRAATEWLSRFDQALQSGDGAEAAPLFAAESYWRDLIAFTWNIKTVEGRDEITAMLDTVLPRTRPSHWRLAEPATEADGVVTAWITFETAVARGKGLLRLRDGLCWTLLTTMAELKGHEEKRGATRELGAAHGAAPGRRSWRERREAEAEALGVTEQPAVLIVGGGQGGLALGARLKRLEVPTLIVDSHPNAGDQWRNRYKSLCLHDPVWYDHLPYLPFPEHWPVFAPKDKIADWLEAYEKTMELVCWHSTTCTAARYDEADGAWTVTVERDGRPVTLRPKHLVLATGMSGLPNLPSYPGAEQFHRRAAPFEQAPRRRCLARQAGGGDRLQQLGARHLRRPLGERRRRHHGAALLDAHRALGIADGAGAGRLVLRAGGGRWHDDGEGGPDFRLAAVPHHARVPNSGLRGNA